MAVFFLLYLIVEIAAIVAVANAVGVLWMLVLLLAGAIVGSWLAKREGARAMQAVMRTARAGGTPHREVTDGMLIAFGGLLILIPGFVSDVFGLLFLLPPTRGLMSRAIVRRSPAPVVRPQYARGNVVDGEVVGPEPQPGDDARTEQPKIIDPRAE